MITVITKENCEWCDKAKLFLNKKNVFFREQKIDDDLREWLKANHPLVKTVPVIFMDDVLIGGYNDLKERFNEDEDFHKKLLLG